MRLSMKLGIASLAISGLAGVLAVYAPQVPLAFVAAFLACVLGALAAHRGSKWWLAIPCVLTALFVLMLYVGFHAA